MVPTLTKDDFEQAKLRISRRIAGAFSVSPSELKVYNAGILGSIDTLRSLGVFGACDDGQLGATVFPVLTSEDFDLAKLRITRRIAMTNAVGRSDAADYHANTMAAIETLRWLGVLSVPETRELEVAAEEAVDEIFCKHFSARSLDH